MRKYIKSGIDIALPGLIGMLFTPAFCLIGWFVNNQIDPTSNGIFFLYYCFLFIIIFGVLAILGFVGGIYEEYRLRVKDHGVIV